ncbi:IS630 family transposase [Paludisphaera soli]|uniref:IS630 family transposase n=1 Tax=Paludisphaera soli TaxID=2712865 RepID=UPI0013E9BFFC|nr:IS630 family transposase [Paludisphaera soli]
MGRARLPIVAHLSPEEVARRYRACRGGLEKTHWQVVWLLTRSPEPPPPAAVAAQVGLTPAWVRTVLKRWNAEGPAGLADRRAVANGGRPRLSDEQRAALFEALQGRPDDGGMWTGPKVAAYVRGRWGVEVCVQTPWRWMVRWASACGCRGPGTPGPPTPRSKGSGKAALAGRAAELGREHPGKAVELWAEDEARLGLKPVARRAWSPRGTRPTANGRTRCEWLYVYGFVRPSDGRNLELILPAANTDWMNAALAEFARWADPAGEKLLLVLVDDAGWHVARRLEVPPDVVLHRPPPCTPELQPAEPLWPLVREAIAHLGFDHLDAMQAPLVERCLWLIDHPDAVRGPVGFRWAAAIDGQPSMQFGMTCIQHRLTPLVALPE